jgi:hypothetical protein
MWRNWQTRKIQALVPVKGVEVQLLSSAFFCNSSLRAKTNRQDAKEELGRKWTQEKLGSQ